ncbi:MAG TPA: Coq4 family protein [Burkholderiales bacterium]|nr:Coq4 family protein [Burkholderiales bacterium]
MTTRSIAAFLRSPGAFVGASAWRNLFLAIVLMVAASALFALQAALVKTGLESIAPLELVFFRGLVCAALIFAFARLSRQSLATAHPGGQLVLGTIGFFSLALYFLAIGMLPLVTATALNYTAPLFLALLIGVLRRGSATHAAALWVAAGFVGVCLVLQPSFASGSATGVMYGLLSGVSGAFCYLLLARLGHAGEPQRVTAFWFSLIACVLAGIPTVSAGLSISSNEQVLLVLAIGLLATFAQLAVAKAYAISSPLIPSTLSYSAVVFSSILGALWWGDTLGFLDALGIALIVASGVLVSAGQATAPRAPAPSRPTSGDLEEKQRKREYRKNNLRSVYAAIKLSKDPKQTQYVFMMGEAQDNIAESERVRGQIKDAFADPELERMWQTRFQAERYDVDALMQLPCDTLGGVYARHMKANNLRPDYYKEVKPRHRQQYLRERIHQTHDVWHVLTGFGTDEFGEVGLQGFYLAQFTNGQAAIIGAAAILKSVLRGRFGDLEKHVDAFCQGYCAGRRAESLLTVKWEELWGERLEDVRRRFRIEPPRCRAGMLRNAVSV